MSIEYRFESVVRPGACRPAMQEIRAALARHLRDPQLLADLDLAITEAVANVVRHAYPQSGGEGPMRVLLRFHPGHSVELEFADQGRGLPAEVARRLHPGAAVPEPGAEGGRGLFILQSLADELDVGVRDGWNVISFRKNVEQGAWN